MIRPQYHFRRDAGRVLVWNIAKLIAELGDDPSVTDISLDQIREIDAPYWYDLEGATPTCRSILHHARLIKQADLKWPILLCPEGRVMDGMHRVLKALDLGHTHIAAHRLAQLPSPDFVDPDPRDLTY